MEIILNHLITYKFYYLFSIVVLLIIILIVTKPKKVKPIEVTIDDVKDEKTDIERVLESLEENQNSRPMTTFEEEQEANAIISYQELVEAVRLKKELMGETAKVDAHVELKKEEPKDTFNLEMFVNSVETKEENTSESINLNENVNLAVEDVNDVREETKKFKSSEFISPIFGKDSNKTNDEFLKELKDFRSNL